MPRIPVVAYQTPIGSANPAGGNGLNPAGTTLPMRAPALPREQFTTRQQNRTQSATRQATQQAAASDDADCSVIRGVSFTANVTLLLAHGLTDSRKQPRAWTSYRIENVQTTFARFIAAHVSAAQDAALIAVTADANCIADVRVW